MRCSEFLEIYSDYRDGLITDPNVARRVRRHLRRCVRCMDYDARVARGVMALKAAHEIEPDLVSVRRLRRRVRESVALPEPVEPVRPLHAGIMVALMVCTGIAMVIWAGTDRAPEIAATPSSADARSEAEPQLRPVGPRSETVEELADWDIPVFVERGPAQPQRAVPFETWVASPR